MKEFHLSKELSTIIKGLSCLLIVAHHYCSWLDGKGIDNFIIHFIGVRGGVIGVTVFFFLSAWGLSESQTRNKYSFGTYVSRRLTKVYMPLVLTNFCYIILQSIFGHSSFTTASFLLKLFNFKLCDGVLWFCNVILIFYFIFYFSFLPSSKWIKFFLCLMATILYSILATMVYPDAPFYVYSIIAFPLGMFLSLFKDNIFNVRFICICFSPLLVFMGVGAFLFPLHFNLFVMNIFSFILIICLVLLASYADRIIINRRSIVFSFIGAFSYEIYLIHNKFLYPMGSTGNIFWYPLAFMLLVIPLSILLNKLSKVISKVFLNR